MFNVNVFANDTSDNCDLLVATSEDTTNIYVDASDYIGVSYAANALAEDIYKITGVKGNVVNSKAEAYIVVGTKMVILQSFIKGRFR